jgi:xylose isomerase
MIADRILRESDYLEMRRERYATFNSGEGATFEAGELGLEELARLAVGYGEPPQISGKQELYEGLVNRYLS